MSNKSKFWFQIARSKFLRRSKDTYDLIWFSLIWFDLIWFDVIWFDLMWFDLIWFDLIWFDLIWLKIMIIIHLQYSEHQQYRVEQETTHSVHLFIILWFVIHWFLILLSTRFWFYYPLVSGFSSTRFWFYYPLCCSSDCSPLIFPPLSSFLSSLFYSPLLSSIWIFLISIDYFSQFFLKSSRPNCGWWIWYSVRLAKIWSDFCTSVTV